MIEGHRLQPCPTLFGLKPVAIRSRQRCRHPDPRLPHAAPGARPGCPLLTIRCAALLALIAGAVPYLHLRMLAALHGGRVGRRAEVLSVDGNPIPLCR